MYFDILMYYNMITTVVLAKPSITVYLRSTLLATFRYIIIINYSHNP